MSPQSSISTSISILGCGWFGLDMAKKLLAEGYHLKGSTTSPEKIATLQEMGITPFLIGFEETTASYDPAFFQTDLLIISIPPKRSSGAQDTFFGKIKQISAAASQHGVKQVIFISATSVFGDQPAILTETATPKPVTASGKAMLDAEQFLMAQKDFQTTIVRFAGLVGPGRNPGRFFAGKTDIPNGQAPVNLIHLDDCTGIVHTIISKEAFGHIYHACSPDHPSRQDFYRLAASSSGLEIPVFKDELLDWKTIGSKHVPEILRYPYQISNWTDWLNHGNK